MAAASVASRDEPAGDPPAAGAPRLRTAPGMKPVSAFKIERIVARSAGILGVVFGLQSLPIMLGQLDGLQPFWADVVNYALFGGLAMVALATAFNRFVLVATGWVAWVYVLSLAAWPLLVIDPSIFVAQMPWLWFLCTIATACAAVAFPAVWAAVYTIVVPLIYGILRTSPSGGSVDTGLAALDAVYAIMLGLVVLIIITMLRQAAAAVDVAQAAALATYSTAVRQHATELERIEVDAIVHDSVLTTLLSAASTRTTDDELLAARMATEAIARLDAAGAVLPGDDRVVPVLHLERRLRGAIAVFSAPVSTSIGRISGLKLPVQATEALYSAAVQALVNSMQHAGGTGSELALRRPVRRTLSLEPSALGGVRIEIADTGVGFDDAQIPSARIGLRVSILERITAVGGDARVESAPGMGTLIVLEWPTTRAGLDPDAGERAVSDSGTESERDRRGVGA